MKRIALFAALLLAPVSLSAQSIKGVWKQAEVTVVGGTRPGHHVQDVQPGLAIFTDTHYSVTTVDSWAPRPMTTPTTSDSVWRTITRDFTGNAGTYQLKDSTMTYTPLVAMNPTRMDQVNTATFRVRGDSLWITQKYATVTRSVKLVLVARI